MSERMGMMPGIPSSAENLRRDKGMEHDFRLAGRGAIDHNVKPIDHDSIFKGGSGASQELSKEEMRANQVYEGYASGVEAAIMQHQMDKEKPRISDKELIEKQTKLRDDITFLKSELQRYVGIMSQARSNNEVSTVKDMMDAIKLTEDKKAKLEAELESLAG